LASRADSIIQAIYTVFLAAGSLFGGLCGGYIVAAKGLAWIHWVNVILSAITFVLVFFFQAETMYDRPQTTVQLSTDVDKPAIETKESVIIADQAAPSSYPPYTYMRSLKLITYRPGIFQKLMAPYKTLRFPGVWLVSLWYSGLVGLIVIMSTIGPQILAAPPYSWGQKVGLINVGGIIGSVLGCVSLTNNTAITYTADTFDRFIPISAPIGPPNVSRKKIDTVSLSQNHVS
jgi:MFS family permease